MENLTNQISVISIQDFTFNLIWSCILSFLLIWTYNRFGRSLSNKKQFSYNFFIISMTTMFIITVVKSSLALSLGLVGALSIIRFRTAIKEPEELAYLFIAISIGLGLGASQTIVTTIAVIITLSTIILYNKFFVKNEIIENMILVIESNESVDRNLSSYISIITRHCRSVNLKRYDAKENFLEASFIVEMDNESSLIKIEKGLLKLDKNISISFIDNKGLFQ